MPHAGMCWCPGNNGSPPLRPRRAHDVTPWSGGTVVRVCRSQEMPGQRMSTQTEEGHTMTDPHFSHTKLVVEDLERSASFYGAALGLQEFGRADAEMNGRPGTEVMFAPTGEGGPMFVLVKFHDEARPSHSDVLLG